MRKIKYSFIPILLFFSIAKALQEPVPDFYPLEVGDFIEYNTNFPGQFGAFTIYREIISDTTLSNGFTYKIVKLCCCANTLGLEPSYTFERKDGEGKVYIYYNNQDVLLFDFNLASGTIYPSPYKNLSWKIFHIDSQTARMILIDEKENLIQQIDFIKGIGPFYYSNIEIDDFYFESNIYYWASVINGQRKGKLFSLKDSLLSDKYYPLNSGDIFVYKDFKWFVDPMPSGFIVKRVLEDTVLIDGLTYKKIKYELLNLPNLYSEYSYERKDECGNIYESNGYVSTLKLKNTFCLGDTFYSHIFYENFGEPWYVYSKSASEFGGYIEYWIFSGQIGGDVWLYDTLGIWGYGSNTLARGGGLAGAIINGELWGDTSTVITRVEESNPVNRYNFYQNFPNPFNLSTQINYSLQESNFVTLKVFNSIGELISTLVSEEKPAGSYSVTFSAKGGSASGGDDSGLPSGIYFYRITSGSFNQTRKMILLK